MNHDLINVNWTRETTNIKMLSTAIAKYKLFLTVCRGLDPVDYHFKINEYIENLLHDGRINISDREFFREERERNLREYHTYLWYNANPNRIVDDFTLDAIDDNRRLNGH